MLEARKGYPQHAWIAVGHMAEAEDELLEKYEDMAHTIRDERTHYMDKQFTYQVPILDLLAAIDDIEQALANDTDEVIDAPHADVQPPGLHE